MMNREEFLNLVWRLEEKLAQLDYFRGRIGQCPGKCEGTDSEEGLCPICNEWFMKVTDEQDRLEHDQEFDDIMKKLKQACEDDKSGVYDRILSQARNSKSVH